MIGACFISIYVLILSRVSKVLGYSVSKCVASTFKVKMTSTRFLSRYGKRCCLKKIRATHNVIACWPVWEKPNWNCFAPTRSSTNWSRGKYTWTFTSSTWAKGSPFSRSFRRPRKSTKFSSCTQPSRRFGSETVCASRTSANKPKKRRGPSPPAWPDWKRDCASLLEVNKSSRPLKNLKKTLWHDEPTISEVSFK